MWAVAQLKPTFNAAAVAIANLRRQGFATFHPTFAVRKVRRHKVCTVLEPVFLNYLFVELHDGQRWVPINSTLGVLRLLVRKSASHEYDEPSPVPNTFVEQLRGCAMNTLGNGSCLLRPGTTVRITGGPFANRDAIVTWADADRVALLVWLMNRNVQVTVAVADVSIV